MHKISMIWHHKLASYHPCGRMRVLLHPATAQVGWKITDPQIACSSTPWAVAHPARWVGGGAQSYKSNAVPPPQIFGLVGPPKKRVNRDKLNNRQKLRVMCFNQQFCTKINYFSSIQWFILIYPPPSFTHEKLHPVSWGTHLAAALDSDTTCELRESQG